MALQTVNISVLDDQVPAQPVELLTVRVFLMDDVTIVTEGLTDPIGLATFTLDDVNPSYLLRFYKMGAAMAQPVTVSMAGPVFDFSYIAQLLFLRPVATDPLMCRVSGYLKNPYGGAVGSGYKLRVRAIRDPAIRMSSPPNLIMAADEETPFDGDGYTVFDLQRCALHDIIVPGWVDSPLLVEVPDAAWVDLADLLLPTPVEVAVGPDDTVPVTVGVGDKALLHPRALLSNGVWLADNRMKYTNCDFSGASDDDGIATIDEAGHADGQMIIRGVALGTTSITIDIANPELYFGKRVPPAPTQSVTVQVFVVL